jgi:uncharacterized protein (DUF362 family)
MIIDSIVGIEGEGYLIATPKFAGVNVIVWNSVATEATAARIMAIAPLRVPYLHAAYG